MKEKDRNMKGKWKIMTGHQRKRNEKSQWKTKEPIGNKKKKIGKGNEWSWKEMKTNEKVVNGKWKGMKRK